MMANVAKIQLGDFCRRLEVEERQARYVLEEGYVPQGVAESPRTGNYRQFGPGQAFWLAILLKLKQSGVKTPLAAEVADYAMRALRETTQNLNWDWPFQPEKGWFDSEHKYLLEVGDLKYVRLATTACPENEGQLYRFDWVVFQGRRQVAQEAEPFVVLQVDLTRIARALRGAGGWSGP